MIRLLVSVRSVQEALQAAAAGADLIDLKEPRAGALGGLPPARVSEIVETLRRQGRGRLISATIGDWPMEALADIVDHVHAVADCGVDYVKVGIENKPDAPSVLSALALCGRPVVPVFIADQGLDEACLAQACRGPFPALMLDTADKLAGSLFDCLDDHALGGFIGRGRRAGKLVGLAGALRAPHLSRLRALSPDFAGFRTAVCSGDRSAALDTARVRTLGAALRSGAALPCPA